jgi:hypothetical protein
VAAVAAATVFPQPHFLDWGWTEFAVARDVVVKRLAGIHSFAVL